MWVEGNNEPAIKAGATFPYSFAPRRGMMGAAHEVGMRGKEDNNCSTYRTKDVAAEFIRKVFYFLCNLRSLRLYRRAKTSAMNPITAKVVNAMSTFVIVINLHCINNKSCDKEENNPNYFLCNLRDLRSDNITMITPMTPITAKVVNAMSMFDIVIYLLSIKIKSHDKKCKHSN